MKVVLLAAGFATRLYPLTRNQAKPLLEVAGAPVITHLLRRVQDLPGVSEVLVVTNGRFSADFEAWAAEQSCPVPLRVLDDGSSSDDDKLGAVADLGLCLQSFADDGREDVLVVAGDNLIEFALEPFAARFAEVPGSLMLCRQLTSPPPPKRYGEIEADGEMRITRFREKPENPTSLLAATCIWFLTSAARAEVARYLDDDSNHDAPGYFMEHLTSAQTVYAMPVSQRFFDIGNLESLEEARREYGG